MNRKSKKPAAARVARAKSVLGLYAPFYGTILANLDMIESDKFPTMATNGVQCYFNPAFVDGKTDAELIFVEAHEASHCSNLHHTRRGNRDPELWNIAADYVINLELVEAEIGTMPKDGLLDYRFKGMSTEQVFAILKAEREQPQGQDQDQPQGQPQGEPEAGEGTAGQSDTAEDEEGATDQPGASQGQDQPEQGQQGGQGGSGQPDQQDDQGDQDDDQGGQDEQPGQDDAEDGEGDGEGQDDPQDGEGDGEGQDEQGQGDPGGCGQILDAADSPAETADQEREWQTITRQALNAQMRHDAGKLPAHLQRLANDLNKPRQNWRDVLRRFIDQANRFDYSYQKPDRRFTGADFILPGLIPDGINHIVIVRDTSGSINQPTLAKFNAEAQALMDDGLIDRLTVIDCDAAIHRNDELAHGDTIPAIAIGGGGTSYRPVWHWLKDQQEVSAVVYFTDLDPNDGFGDEPAVPVLWAAWPSVSQDYLNRCMAKTPWGEIVELTD